MARSKTSSALLAKEEAPSSQSTRQPHSQLLGDNKAPTVSELSRALKEHVEDRFSRVSVRGEISGVKISRQGNLYFTLKDEKAALDAVCWSGRVGRLQHKPEEGLEVVAHGSLSTYPSRSRYQMEVEALDPAGTGALLQQLERRKKKLAAEGLFATERKRKLPLLPKRIAVFTSEQGAVWHDIRQRLGQRCPVNVALFPTAVQGREAEGNLLQAFALLDEVVANKEHALDDLQVLIVARGGGSIEDLLAFSEESVVRAAVACRLPVVSAIGHESDDCLLDHAADLRAPTPTAAVELVVPERAVLRERILVCCERTFRIVEHRLEESEERLDTARRALPRALQTRATQAGERLQRSALTLRHVFASFAQGLRERLARQRLSARWLVDTLARARARLTEQEKRRQRALGSRLALAEERLLRSRRLLESLSFQRVLERGYAIVREGGHIVRSACALPEGTSFDTLFADRSILSARAYKVVRPPSKKEHVPEQKSPARATSQESASRAAMQPCEEVRAGVYERVSDSSSSPSSSKRTPPVPLQQERLKL